MKPTGVESSRESRRRLSVRKTHTVAAHARAQILLSLSSLQACIIGTVKHGFNETILSFFIETSRSGADKIIITKQFQL